MAAQQLGLAALGVGLEGAIVAGVVSSAARPLLHIDGYERAALAVFTTGSPVVV
jgi:hypothetical protein